MDSEVKGNPKPTRSPDSSLWVQRSRCMVGALLHQQELWDGRMKRNGKKEARKNSRRGSQEQHNRAVFLSISKFNFMLYIRGESQSTKSSFWTDSMLFHLCWMSQLLLWGVMIKLMFL